MMSRFPVQLLISTPSGPLPLTAERARLLLPRGPDSDGPELRYGPYLNSLSRFLLTDSNAPLLTALGKHLGQDVSSKEIEKLELISEKHGALYHVSRLRVRLIGKKTHNLVMNVATSPEQQAFLENECNLLNELYTRFGLPYLPRPYLLGKTVYEGEEEVQRDLTLFLAEWFDGFHEFHLSQRSEEGDPVIKVWYLKGVEETLSVEQTRSLYRQAAVILTAYVDEQSFRQIYPWHHAAGDFILKPSANDVDLKLVTARDYRCLPNIGGLPEDLWIALIHFFLNLTLRLRLDRLDGTGALAWASSDCLSPILSGFLEAWTQKVRREASLPSSVDVLEALRDLTTQEWHALAEIVLEDGLVEADERTYIGPRLDEHIAALYAVLQAKTSGE